MSSELTFRSRGGESILPPTSDP